MTGAPQKIERILTEKQIDKLFGFDVTGLSWSHDKQGSMLLHVSGLRFEQAQVTATPSAEKVLNRLVEIFDGYRDKDDHILTARDILELIAELRQREREQ